jgi:hypothetical protein
MMQLLSIDFNHTNHDFDIVRRNVLLLCMVWFITVLLVALSGGFEMAVDEPPAAILFAVIAPVVLFGVVYMTISAFRDWVLMLDMRQLILLHSWRMVGVGFVFLYFYGQLPALFALPAGIGDAVAAIGALFLGIALFKNASAVSRRKVFLWNTFGLLDFIIAVSLGIATRTNEWLYIENQASSNIMGQFPLVLIPGFAVPFYIITHIIIYVQLKQR